MNIYVGNLNFDTTEHQIHELFANYGKVQSTTFIMDRETQRPRGFGFVIMNDQTEAEAAIKAIDGQEVDGRCLKVTVARGPARS